MYRSFGLRQVHFLCALLIACTKLCATLRLQGEILLDGKNILDQTFTLLRRRVGMVFQRPNPFPKSIFENVAYGLRINGSLLRSMAEAVEKSLCIRLSLGRSERPVAQVCLRSFRRPAAAPPASLAPPSPSVSEVLLLDEPCSALDPISTAKIEAISSFNWKDLRTIVTVTHNMQQAACISDFTAFLLTGQLDRLQSHAAALPSRVTRARKRTLLAALADPVAGIVSVANQLRAKRGNLLFLLGLYTTEGKFSWNATSKKI